MCGLGGVHHASHRGVLETNKEGITVNRVGKSRKPHQSTGRKNAHNLRKRCVERIERREARLQWGV